MWSVRKQDFDKLLVFEWKVLQKIFSPGQDVIIGEWWIHHNQEFHELYKHTDIVRLITGNSNELDIWQGLTLTSGL